MHGKIIPQVDGYYSMDDIFKANKKKSKYDCITPMLFFTEMVEDLDFIKDLLKSKDIEIEMDPKRPTVSPKVLVTYPVALYYARAINPDYDKGINEHFSKN